MVKPGAAVIKRKRRAIFCLSLGTSAKAVACGYSVLTWIFIAYKNLTETQRTFSLCLRQMVEVEMGSEYVTRIQYPEVQIGSGGFK